MITSVLLVDINALANRRDLELTPAMLAGRLSQTADGVTREIKVLRAYCGPAHGAAARRPWRDAGFEIVDTAGPDDALASMSLDLADLALGDVSHEEMIVVGDRDYSTALRIAKAQHVQVTVNDHDSLPNHLRAISDRVIDLAGLTEAVEVVAPIEQEPTPAPEAAPEAATEGDPWPSPNAKEVLVAGGGAGLALAAVESEPVSQEEDEPSSEVDATVVASASEEDQPSAAEPDQTVSVEDGAADLDAMEAELAAVSLTELDGATTPPPLSDTSADEPVIEESSTNEAELVDGDPLDNLFEELVPERPSSGVQESVMSVEGEASESELAAPQSETSADEDAERDDEASEDDLGEVDALFSKLLSDDLNLEPAGSKDTKPALDIVPER